MKIRKLPFLILVIVLRSMLGLALPKAAPIFHLNRLPHKDTLLTGWTLKAGNAPLWAEPGFDDSQWRPCIPSQDVNTLTPGNTYWLRLHIWIDSPVKTEDFAFMIRQNVASIIYIDGKSFTTFGTVSGNVKAYNPLGVPLHVKLSPGNHLIAVQLFTQKNIPAFRPPSILGFSFPAFRLAINEQNNALANYEEHRNETQLFLTMNWFLAGVFFILSIIHLVLYRYYRKQKAHVYYGIMMAVCFCMGITNISFFYIHNISVFIWVLMLGLGGLVEVILLTLTVYALFDYRHKTVIVIILAVIILAETLLFTNGLYAFYLLYIIIPLLNAAECIRVGIWAKRNGKKHAILVTTGIVLFLVLLVAQLLISGTLSTILFMAAMLSLPVGMAIFLAIQTANTSRSLELKLTEVQELSTKNLEYQLEKQQILTSQNELLEEQVSERTAELSISLNNLKAAQNQLIQTEKMASLGELTAGIAHEIQNPLNFVNNFSEVNAELIDEMQVEIEKGDLEEIKAIAGDIKENQQKISQHGKRADFIVKGMLEHSRTSTGEKQLTNINILADEFLKLSYHGLRAKDKLFNTEMITHFDNTLPKINIVQQDIGRVLLNLFNNAFYAVNQKQKTAGKTTKAGLK